MADGISVASGMVALVTFAFQASTVLYTTIRSFKSQEKNARALKDELVELSTVLQSLLETVTGNPDIDFEALRLPLYRCGKTCEEYGDLVARCTKYSNATRPSIRDWMSQRYLKGDIVDFREMLSGYKSTINIALANVNLRIVASISPDALEAYKDMIQDASSDLHAHLKRLDERVQAFPVPELGGSAHNGTEWLAMLEEKESTQQGLKLCVKLSAQIESMESMSEEHPQFSQQPSAHKFMKSGLGVAKSSILDLISRLQTHENDIEKKIEVMRSTLPLSEHEATQLAQLQETKESIRQCVHVVSDAGQALVDGRQNIFEGITMTDDSYGITVSTVRDLVVARQVNLRDRARYVGGQLSDESYQRTIDALTQLDRTATSASIQVSQQQTDDTGTEAARSVGFDDRYGRGFQLSPPVPSNNPPEPPL